MKKIYFLSLIGGILAILLGLFHVFLGLVFSNALKSFGFYASDGPYSLSQVQPNLARFETFTNIVYGSVGLFVGAIGIIGGKIGKIKGGILLITAGIASLIVFGILGLIPLVLLLISGVLVLRESLT